MYRLYYDMRSMPRPILLTKKVALRKFVQYVALLGKITPALDKHDKQYIQSIFYIMNCVYKMPCFEFKQCEAGPYSSEINKLLDNESFITADKPRFLYSRLKYFQTLCDLDHHTLAIFTTLVFQMRLTNNDKTQSVINTMDILKLYSKHHIEDVGNHFYINMADVWAEDLEKHYLIMNAIWRYE